MLTRRTAGTPRSGPQAARAQSPLGFGYRFGENLSVFRVIIGQLF